MASIITNRGKALLLQWTFQQDTVPSTFYGLLVMSGSAPTVDDNLVSDITEINVGNGYSTGGVAVPIDTGNVVTEDDTNDQADVVIDAVQIFASGGPIPASGSDYTHLAITTDEGTVANRQIILFMDLGGANSIPDGYHMTISGCTLRLQEA